MSFETSYEIVGVQPQLHLQRKGSILKAILRSKKEIQKTLKLGLREYHLFLEGILK